MILDAFATKLGMTQAWTKNGKRLPVTRVSIDEMAVVGTQDAELTDQNQKVSQPVPCKILELGFGTKKLKNVAKPLRSRLEKGGFSSGYSQIVGVRVVDDTLNPSTETEYKVGDKISTDSVLEVGDVVKVQGISKGRGFAGAMKRHGFAGGPATHGQSDRARAVGSIGAGTTPGKVWKGQKMPGHYGAEAQTVTGLVVLHIDKENGEIWLSGPVPGSKMNMVRITKEGTKKTIDLDYSASNIVVPQQETTEESKE